VKGSYLSPYAYEESMRIIQSGKFQLGNVITHIFPLEKVNEAFQTVIKREGEVIKALIDPWL
ncbi:MAG: erythritol/L-threitol dehydrogenase, partial [Candidatus Bathyarchaeia archaeon]